MKKILILAYDFPPYNSVGGQRPYSWLMYLKEFGYEPIVVTRHWDEAVRNSADYIKPSKNQNSSVENYPEGIVYRAPFNPNKRDKMLLKHGINNYVFLRKLLSFFYMLLEFIFDTFDNRKTIYMLARQAVKDHKIDLIIATGEPFILFKYASALSKEFGIPWVADYRDGWSTNYTRSRIEKMFYSVIEKKIVHTASKIITVSPEIAVQLKEFLNRKVEVIYNGFFEEKFKVLEKQVKQDNFVISFSGTLYLYQPIELFAQGVSLFVKNKRKVVIKFIGALFYPDQAIRIENAFNEHKDIIELTNRLSQEEAIESLNRSSVLLLLADASYPLMPAKGFDYLALRKKIILCTADHGSSQQIISETNSGIICNTSEEIAAVLEDMYVEWEEKGFVTCDSKGIEKYSRKNQTKVLVKNLSNVFFH